MESFSEAVEDRRRSEADREANVRWIRSTVRPTFEQFARSVAVRGSGPIVSTSALVCVIKVADEEIEDSFEAQVGLKALDSPDLVVQIPGNPDPFGERRREEIDEAAVHKVLTSSFHEWRRQRLDPQAADRQENAPA